MKKASKSIVLAVFSLLQVNFTPFAAAAPESLSHPWTKAVMEKKYPKAPDFQGLNLQNNKRIRLSDFTKAGKPVWVLFWRLHSCGVCRQQLSEAELHYPEIKKLGGEIIAISSNSAQDTDLNFRKSVNFSFPIIADTRFEWIDKYQVKNPEDQLARPSSFVVNPKGEIVYLHIAKDINSRVSAREIRDVFQFFFAPTL